MKGIVFAVSLLLGVASTIATSSTAFSKREEDATNNSTFVSYTPYSNLEEKRSNSNIRSYYGNLLDETIVNNYEFYLYVVGGNNYYVADVLDPSKYKDGIVQLVLIDNPSTADFVDPALFGTPIIKISRYIDGNLYTSNCEIDDGLANRIRIASITLSNDLPMFERVISSFNIQFDLIKRTKRASAIAKASAKANIGSLGGIGFPPVVPPVFPPISKNEDAIPLANDPNITNYQEPLDYYLSIKDNFGQLVSKYASYITPNPELITQKFFDDPITSIIPRSLFVNDGSAIVVGKEFGYFIETVSNHSSVLIFDVISCKLSNRQRPVIGIAPAFSRNFTYNEFHDYVFEWSENNLCIANPESITQIRYLTLDDDGSQSVHPNPGDEEYSEQNDNGARIASYKVLGHGHYKNFDQIAFGYKVKVALGIAADLFSSFLPVPTAFQLGVDYALNWIIDSGFDFWAESVEGEGDSATNDSGREQKENSDEVEEKATWTSNAINFDSAKGNDFAKMAYASFKNEKDVFLKTPDDYFACAVQIDFRDVPAGSSSWEAYSLGVEHLLTGHIYEDNSSIFNPNPDLLTSFSINFGQIYGDSIQQKGEKNISAGNRYSFASGSGYKNRFNFVPEKTGDYLFTLSNLNSQEIHLKSDEVDFVQTGHSLKPLEVDIDEIVGEGSSGLFYVDISKSYSAHLEGGKSYSFSVDNLENRFCGAGFSGILEVNRANEIVLEDYQIGSLNRSMYVGNCSTNGEIIRFSTDSDDVLAMTSTPKNENDFALIVYDSLGRRIPLVDCVQGSSIFFRSLADSYYYVGVKSENGASLLLEQGELLPTIRKSQQEDWLKLYVEYDIVQDKCYIFGVAENGLLTVAPLNGDFNPHFVIEVQNITDNQSFRCDSEYTISIPVEAGKIYNLVIYYGAQIGKDYDSTIVYMSLS